jgi:hypothetical protein
MQRVFSFVTCVVAGCTTVPAGHDTFLRLNVTEFNAKGTSWRALENRGEYLSAARLLEAYIAQHSASLPEDERVLLHFHAAQEFAFVGEYARALPHFPLARYAVEPSSFPMRWNDYVAATEAFLKRDRSALLRARDRIVAGPKWNGEILTLNVVDSLFEHFDESYLDAYMKAPKPPNKAPEPTSCSVTPRAIEAEAEMKQRKEGRSAARVAPEQAVAHL